MKHTIEVRVPFLDRKLAEYVLSLPAGYKVSENKTKHILREAMKGLLPEYILAREKVVLSEGMGLKGNSTVDGLFTDKILESVDVQLLDALQQKFPEYNLNNKEEAYYLDIYDKLNFTKLWLSSRPVANKVNSIDTSEIEKVFNKKRFARDEPEHIKSAIRESVRKEEPIQIVGFWGVGNKGKPDGIDRKAIQQLQLLEKRVHDVYSKGISFTFIISDEHGRMNGVPDEKAKKYVSSIVPLLEKTGFSVVLLSDIWEKYGISEEKILRSLHAQEVDWWTNIPEKETLLKNAELNNQVRDQKEAAQVYCIMRQMEKKMLEREFQGEIFHTYSSSDMRFLFPDMPIYYMRARRGWCDAPWFAEERAQKNQ